MNLLPDRFRLIGGPYNPPKVRRGDWLHDEIRGQVEVGGYTSALIPWPRVKKTGAASLVFCGDLVRAVKTESSLAIQHWFGVSETVVWRWRKHLGISQTGTEGTLRLYREYLPNKLPEEIAARGRQEASKPESVEKARAAKRGRPMPSVTREALLAASRKPKNEAWKEKHSESMRRQWQEGERKPPVWTSDQDARLLDLHAQGLTAREIGIRMGKTRDSILARLQILNRRKRGDIMSGKKGASGGVRPGAGRPLGPGGAKTARLMIRLSPEDMAALETAAAAQGITKAEFARQLIEKYLQNTI